MWQYLNAIHAIKVVAISTSACTLSSSCNREKQLKSYDLQKDVISTQKQPGYKKRCGLKKSCEIQGGSQEMAMMAGQWQKFLIRTIQVNGAGPPF